MAKAKKQWTPEERKAFGEKMRAAREAKKNQQQPAQAEGTAEPVAVSEPPVTADQPENLGPVRYAPSATLETDLKSMLESINEDSIVEIFNPLPQAFEVVFATTAYQQPEISIEERQIRDKAGISHFKGGGTAVTHLQRTTLIPANSTIRLPGKIAHVAIRQLRNHLIAYEGRKKFMADPLTQVEYEKRIIVKISSQLSEAGAVDPQAELDRKIAELNSEPAVRTQ